MVKVQCGWQMRLRVDKMLDLLPYVSEYEECRRRLLWDFVRMLFVKPKDNLLLWHLQEQGELYLRRNSVILSRSWWKRNHVD